MSRMAALRPQRDAGPLARQRGQPVSFVMQRLLHAAARLAG